MCVCEKEAEAHASLDVIKLSARTSINTRGFVGLGSKQKQINKFRKLSGGHSQIRVGMAGGGGDIHPPTFAKTNPEHVAAAAQLDYVKRGRYDWEQMGRYSPCNQRRCKKDFKTEK